MPKRGRSLMPPQWPPKSFSGALEDDTTTNPQPSQDDAASDLETQDPLARLDAVTASPAWKVPPRGHAQALITTGPPSATLTPDAYRGELEQIGREIESLRLLLLQAEREIETQTQRQEFAQSEVAKVEHRLQQHSHEEIRAAYAHASETEMRAFMASEQRDQMIAKLQAFERYERFLRGAVEALESAASPDSALANDRHISREWRNLARDLTTTRYADDIDDYEALWMTPTAPIPVVKITPTHTFEPDDAAADENDQADSVAAFPDDRGMKHPSDDEIDIDSLAPTEIESAQPSVPLPKPQLPDELTSWDTEDATGDDRASETQDAPGASQHVVVMGPRTASLAFRGEERGQWEGAHAVLNRVVQAQEEVAERVARQIQDVSLQALTQLALEAGYFEQQAAQNPRAALEGLQQVRAQLNAALQSANSALLSIRPMGDGSTSLVGALRRYAMSITTQFNLPFEFQSTDREPPLAPETVKAAFRVGQEAMLNTARHAHASLLLVSLSYTSDALRLVVEDDGVGFDAEQEVKRAIKRSAGGLLAMLERAELLGGHLRIDSMPGSGCNVELLVPLPQR